MTEYSCTLAHWLVHGPEIIRANPDIEKVIITDKSPLPIVADLHDDTIEGYSWQVFERSEWPSPFDELVKEGEHHLPRKTHDLLHGAVPASPFLKHSREYPTTEDAREDLSRAILDWARGRK